MDRVISLVNDLLFVQEQDLIEPALRPVSLPALVEIIIDEVADDARDHGSNIRVSVPPDLPTLQADPDGLVRAFGKLLDNAVKFSPEGGDITIAARRLGRWIEIDFIDQGIGITEAFLPHVFERFAHTDRIGDHVFGGVGLGLAIAKHIIESHGGSITVSSQPGQGSTFTVHLPLDAGRPQLRGSADTPATANHRPGTEPWVDADAHEG
jgi:two-component system phosphate regulon sensor histidine kinase PhoR